MTDAEMLEEARANFFKSPEVAGNDPHVTDLKPVYGRRDVAEAALWDKVASEHYLMNLAQLPVVPTIALVDRIAGLACSVADVFIMKRSAHFKRAYAEASEPKVDDDILTPDEIAARKQRALNAVKNDGGMISVPSTLFPENHQETCGDPDCHYQSCQPEPVENRWTTGTIEVVATQYQHEILLLVLLQR